MINGNDMAYPDIRSELLFSCPAIQIMALARSAMDSNRFAVIEGEIVQAILSLFKGAKIDKFPLALCCIISHDVSLLGRILFFFFLYLPF